MSENSNGTLVWQQWNLVSTGCLDASTNCMGWVRGLEADQCLYNYGETVLTQKSGFTFRQPAFTSLKAGFDDINVDRYRDFGKHKSGMCPKYHYSTATDGQKLYPDHWISAELRQQKGVSMAYRDMDKIPSVPAFVISAKQILQNISHNHVARKTLTGANRVPLKARISNKRTPDDLEPRSASEVKRIKREDNTLVKSFQPSQSLATGAESQSYWSRPVLSTLANNQVVKPKKASRKQAARKAAQVAIRQATRMAFEKVHNKLAVSEANIGKDRETLRVRWELDVNLQLQTVTDDLEVLNECFTRAESAIRDAREIIEDRLL